MSQPSQLSQLACSCSAVVTSDYLEGVVPWDAGKACLVGQTFRQRQLRHQMVRTAGRRSVAKAL